MSVERESVWGESKGKLGYPSLAGRRNATYPGRCNSRTELKNHAITIIFGRNFLLVGGGHTGRTNNGTLVAQSGAHRMLGGAVLRCDAAVRLFFSLA